MNTIKPIDPKELVELHKQKPRIPDEVIEAFNELIAEGFNGKSVIVYQHRVIDAICKKMKISISQVFFQNLLDIEDIYRNNGWNVVYDKPAYNETYKAHFKFSID